MVDINVEDILTLFSIEVVASGQWPDWRNCLNGFKMMVLFLCAVNYGMFANAFLGEFACLI